MIKNINELQLLILPCSPAKINLDFREQYKQAYNLWHKVWSQSLLELDGLKKLYSNEFTRHHFCSAIFKGDTAVSLMCYSVVDLSLEASQNDSWFKSWPENILKELMTRDGLGLFATWFCTDPEFRKTTKNSSINTSQIIIETFGKLVVEGRYNAGYGITRNDRGVGKYSANAGSITATTSIDHGCNVDLVLFEPKIIKDKQLSYSRELQYLWNTRIDFREGKNGKLQKTA